MPNAEHSYIRSMLISLLVNYMLANPMIWVLSGTRYTLPDDDFNSRILDISVVLRTEMPQIGPLHPTAMPLLAIEIQSPGQSDTLMVEKARYYLSHGARLVWLVYPRLRVVEALWAEERYLWGKDETLNAGDLLPGLAIPLQSIFPA